MKPHEEKSCEEKITAITENTIHYETGKKDWNNTAVIREQTPLPGVYFWTLLCLFVLCGSTFSSSLYAQDRSNAEMNIDLSDETEETEVLKKGFYQVETGLLYNSYDHLFPSSISQLLLRYGAADKMEIRILTEEGLRRDQYMDETVQSTFPLALGAKIVLLENRQHLPDISLLTYISLPFTARSNEHSLYWSPLVLVAFQNKGSKWKLDYNMGCQQEAFSKDWAILGNASFHYSLTQNLEAFIEYFAQFQSGSSAMNNIGVGTCYQINDILGVYLSSGSSINSESNNRFVTAGLAVSVN